MQSVLQPMVTLEHHTNMSYALTYCLLEIMVLQHHFMNALMCCTDVVVFHKVHKHADSNTTYNDKDICGVHQHLLLAHYSPDMDAPTTITT